MNFSSAVQGDISKLQKVWDLMHPQKIQYISGWGARMNSLSQIQDMMRKFYSDYPDVAWETNTIDVIEESGRQMVVQVEFTMTYTKQEPIAKHGREWITVQSFDDGELMIVEVH